MQKIINGTSQLIVDLKNKTFKAYSNDNTEKINEAIRAKFREILPERNAMGKYKHRELMNAMPFIFTILEETLDITITDAWKSDPFYREFVDARNLALGDRNDFIIPDNSWATVNKFSGNTWQTDREKYIGGRKLSVETEWFYAHVYDDFERFLLGAISIEELVNHITEGFTRHVDTMISVTFNDAATNLPAVFNTSGPLTMLDMRELIQKVKTASRKNIRIMGTEMAISNLNELAEIKYSDAMKNEVYSTGRLAKWMGNTVVEIPQAFTPGTYDWAVDNDRLLIVPESEKFIKFVDEGETRAQELSEQDNYDQTVSFQVQRKMGSAAIFGSMFGRFVIQ